MEGEGGAVSQTLGGSLAIDDNEIGTPLPQCSGCVRTAELIERYMQSQTGREKLLLDRIGVLSDEIEDLRKQVSAWMANGGGRSAKNGKSKKKGGRELEVNGGHRESEERARDKAGLSRTREESIASHVRDRGDSCDQMQIARGKVVLSRNHEDSHAGGCAGSTCGSIRGANFRREGSRSSTKARDGRRDASDEDWYTCVSSDSEVEEDGRGRRGRRATRRGTRTRTGEDTSIHVPTDDEDLWQLVTNEKPPPHRTEKRKDLFIGNLTPGTTDEKLAEYIQRRAKKAKRDVTLHFVTVAPEDESHELLRARASVNESEADLLLSRSFWPRGIYARPWRFKEQEPEKQSKKVSTQAGGAAMPLEQSQQQTAVPLAQVPSQLQTPLTDGPTPNRKRQRESPLAADSAKLAKASSGLGRRERRSSLSDLGNQRTLLHSLALKMAAQEREGWQSYEAFCKLSNNG